jgi:hypothetical protein
LPSAPRPRRSGTAPPTYVQLCTSRPAQPGRSSRPYPPRSRRAR